MSSAADIADALVAACPVFTDADGTESVCFWRKHPILLDKEPPPRVIVTIGDETETEHLWWYPTGGTDRVTYTAAYTLITIGGTGVVDSRALRTWMQEARNTLVTISTYAALPGFNEVVAGGKPPYPRSAQKSTFNYADVVARVEILEIRPA